MTPKSSCSVLLHTIAAQNLLPSTLYHMCGSEILGPGDMKTPRRSLQYGRLHQRQRNQNTTNLEIDTFSCPLRQVLARVAMTFSLNCSSQRTIRTIRSYGVL